MYYNSTCYIFAQPTILHVAPPLAVFLTKHPLVDNVDMSHVHTFICGAAPLGGAVIQELVDKIKFKGAFRQGIYTDIEDISHVHYRHFLRGLFRHVGGGRGEGAMVFSKRQTVFPT